MTAHLLASVIDISRTAGYFIAVITVLVVAHEYGHFLAAKLLKMRVVEFSVFFWKRVWHIATINGTEYNLRLLPLGGFVKVAGMEPDDLFHGAAMIRPSNGARGEKRLIGLNDDAVARLVPMQIGEEVRQLAWDSVGRDCSLTPRGEADIELRLRNTDLTAEERNYLQQALDTRTHEVDPSEFNQRPIWQRATVILAGPIASLVFGYLLFCGLGITMGLPDPVPTNQVDSVVAGMPAAKVGLEQGDRIVAINGKPIRTGADTVNTIHDSIGVLLHISVERSGHVFQVEATPVAQNEPVVDPRTHRLGSVRVGLIGYSPVEQIVWRHTTVSNSVVVCTETLAAYVTQTLQTLFSRHAFQNLGGAVSIGAEIHQDSHHGPAQVMLTAALLSISIGLLNLFPIPILDGGHLLMMLVEFIRRRKMSSTEVAAFQSVGLAIIAVLVLVVMVHDIQRLRG